MVHFEALNLREAIVFLVAAGLIVPLIQRLRVSPVLGYLIVGLAIGPHGLARFIGSAPWLTHIVITDLEGVRALAELGVVFLLFMIGLELSLDRIWAMRRLVFGLGGAQVVVTGVIIAGIAAFYGNGIVVAIVLGAAFALSSTAIVMQLLSESRRLATATGQTSLSILLLQDLAVLPILFMVAAFAAQDDGSPLLAFGWAMAQAAMAIAIILGLGRLIVRPLFRAVGGGANRDMFLALVLLIIVGTAVVTEHAGLSLALGAFLAGLLFSETEYRHAIEVDIEPFKGLLLGLFFVSIGMGLDLGQMAADPVSIVLSVVGLYVVKVPITIILCRVFGAPRAVATETGLLLGQGGEFAFIVVGMAFSLGLIPADTAQFMLLVTGLSMAATPLIARLARMLALRMVSLEAGSGTAEPNIPSDISGHFVVVGYGRVGQMLGSILSTQELPYIGIDIDGKLVARFQRGGGTVFYGDASRPELLDRLGAGRAAAIVVTMDSPNAAERVVAAARRHWPQLPIYARARDAAHGRRLIALGASHVTPETVEASLKLGEMVLLGAGLPDDAARRVIELRRQSEQAALEEGSA